MAKWFGIDQAAVCNWTIVEYAECQAYRELCESGIEEPEEEIWQGR